VRFLLFDPFPGPHCPGNMWVARCSYIAKLQLPLPEYQQRHKLVDHWLYRDQMPKQILSKTGWLFPFEDRNIGRNRYEAEHYLGGYPSRRPCYDVATRSRIGHWRPNRGALRDFGPNSTARLEWSMAPRYQFPWWDRAWSPGRRNWSPEKRKCDYFLLRGHLYNWMAYYNATARNDAWFRTDTFGELWSLQWAHSRPHTSVIALINRCLVPSILCGNCLEINPLARLSTISILIPYCDKVLGSTQ
jgi:hypothetical protein